MAISVAFASLPLSFNSHPHCISGPLPSLKNAYRVIRGHHQNATPGRGISNDHDPFANSQSLHGGRRRVIICALSALILHPDLSPNWAAAVAVEERNTAKNEFIQKLLEKSNANKAKYDKERLDSYYKRNYKDYFEFVEGSVQNKKENLSEAEKEILEWLRKNR